MTFARCRTRSRPTQCISKSSGRVWRLRCGDWCDRLQHAAVLQLLNEQGCAGQRLITFPLHSDNEGTSFPRKLEPSVVRVSRWVPRLRANDKIALMFRKRNDSRSDPRSSQQHLRLS
jgi:hypothetical protein